MQGWRGWRPYRRGWVACLCGIRRGADYLLGAKLGEKVRDVRKVTKETVKKLVMAELFKTSVDVVSTKGLDPYIAPRVVRDAVAI